MQKLFILSAIIAFSHGIFAQDVTFSEHIAPIIYNNCTQCHRQGEIGPFPMTNFEEIQPWAPMLKAVTETRYMPPWKADPEYSRFLGERFLSQEDIDLIAEWADAGAPQGDPSLEPELPEFASGSQLGEPDLVLSFTESYQHYGGNEDEYRVFVLPTGLAEDKEISAIELRPGNTKIVHHALLISDNTGEGRALDQQDEKYGYDGFGGFGVDGWWNNMFPGYVPGQNPIPFPEGLGQTLEAGSDILIQVHYAPVPFPQTDSSTVNIFFKKEPVERQVENLIMLPFAPYIQNGPFLMAPGSINKFHCKVVVPFKVSLVAIWPHMHLLGQDWTVYVEGPTGDTTNLIRIPDWDFNWQGSYHFNRFIVIEPGSTIHAFATYDNTVNNPGNPSNPPKWVSWGEKTTDEMFFLPLSYVLYNQGDEDVVFNEGQSTSFDDLGELHFPKHVLHQVTPNPNAGDFHIGFHMSVPDYISIRLLDIKGNVVRTISDFQFFGAGDHRLHIKESELPQGVYFLNMRATNFNQTRKISVLK